MIKVNREEENSKKEKVSGYFGSIIFHAALIVLFLFLGLKTNPIEEEGILVNFGDSPTGFGMSEPVRNEPSGIQTTPPSIPTQTSTPPSQSSKPAPVKENVMTQNYEETAKINAEEKKRREEQQRILEDERKQKAEQERQKRIEEDKKRAEEAEKQRIIAEEKRKQEEQERLAQQARNNVNQAFSKTDGTGTSEGVTQGTGNQGHLTGDPNATNRDGTGLGTSGNSFSLAGRSLVGSLPKPVENCNDEGVIVVEVTVDKTGKVTAAQTILSGSRNLTPCLRKAAEEAALKAKFNNDPNAAAAQKGTITYRFGFVTK